MRYYQVPKDGCSRLAVRTNGQVYDLTAVRPELRSFDDLLWASSIAGRTIDEIGDALRSEADVIGCLEALTLPVHPQEIWAAGVTYRISEQPREVESGMPEMYLDVYDAERPELFLKATPGRTVGPDEPIGIRADSEWNVPEPELGVVLYGGEIVGYTVGNDVSSRDIEGENPLYLSQAKVFDRCCALGPCVCSAASIEDPHDLEIWMTIEHEDEVVYEDSTSTSKMVRTVDEPVEYYTRHNAIPERSVLLTGTSLVPDDEFTLREGDVVEIGVEEIGVLKNSVIEV